MMKIMRRMMKLMMAMSMMRRMMREMMKGFSVSSRWQDQSNMGEDANMINLHV